MGPVAAGLSESLESFPGGTGNAKQVSEDAIQRINGDTPSVGPASETGVIGVAHRVFASDDAEELDEQQSED